MKGDSEQGLTAAEVLQRYMEEDLPEFAGLELNEVNQVGIFGNYPIHVAAVRGFLDELKALIEGGADVNATGELGDTPLHDAVGQEHVEAVRLLLQSGADRKRMNHDGNTPLDVARMHGREDIAELLLDS
jgi:ankyrin repeat protein